ncbi:hypothetical protein SAMN05880574_10657 [Chryseobacterium sp. RU37D]|uniref:hypothetical protein n=1 Tax=Chryseobacterium sp. RU37D TaxID=1907397 RepID=UPI0009548776|nr:hypothetical protein [Chryseobacterium sp. RU37D]SIQ13020.1 hypothetical protein SAMN05880574_10657 [Chryseobacterium sp. RU37D]
MKSLYIIAFLALSVNIYAQQDKKVSETQQVPYYKESKDFEAKMMKESQDRASKTLSNTLPSEQGLEAKKQAPKQEAANNSGKLLPNTASIEEIKASIPGRQPHKASISKKRSNTQGLLSTPELTVYDIKKTIPKN